jgi:uncharacterized surface protein with fasciclin (FAS1) repeats
MLQSRSTRFAALATASVLALTLSACGDDDNGDGGDGGTPSPTASATAMAGGETFGAGCSAVPREGEGSFTGMSDDPVASAASNNPVLSTLVSAVQQAGLVDTLNGAEALTVFAPTNDAFAKIPRATLDSVLANKEELTKILTYHVVGQRIPPNGLASSSPLTTLQGGRLTVSGSGENFTVGTQNAKVVCGNVQTKNATVYIIDTVLMPPAA